MTTEIKNDDFALAEALAGDNLALAEALAKGAAKLAARLRDLAEFYASHGNEARAAQFHDLADEEMERAKARKRAIAEARCRLCAWVEENGLLSVALGHDEEAILAGPLCGPCQEGIARNS